MFPTSATDQARKYTTPSRPCPETLTRIRLDNFRNSSVGFAGKVKPRVVGSGAGVAVPRFPASVLGRCATIDVAVGAFTPEIPSEAQAKRGDKIPCLNARCDGVRFQYSRKTEANLLLGRGSSGNSGEAPPYIWWNKSVFSCSLF